MSELSFYELARTSHIKRWTIINTTKEQNLAEHQYNVTVIGLALGKAAGINAPSNHFILALMFHDSAEIRTGDIPTPGKEFIKKAAGERGGVDIFKAIDSVVMPRTPYTPAAPMAEFSDVAKSIIKLADLIEAAWWIGENGAGHHARTVADKCWRAVEDFVHKHDMYDIANPVLMDLGLPFVNKSERVTPP